MSEAEVQIQKGNYDLALATYEQALNLEPTNREVIKKYAICLSEVSDYYGVHTILEKAKRAGLDDNAFLQGILRNSLNNYVVKLTISGQNLAEIGSYEKALEYYDKALQYDPENIIVLTNYGRVLAELGKYEEAIKLYDTLLQKTLSQRDSIIILNSYARALTKAEKYQKACQKFEELLNFSRENDNDVTLASYATCLAKSQQYEKAFSFFERSLKINPDNIDTLANYTKALIDGGEPEKAFDLLKHSLPVRDDYFDSAALARYAQLLGLYAKNLVQIGNYKEACSFFKESLEIKSNNYILFLYALSLESLNQYREAIYNLKKINLDELPQYHKNVVYIALGRLFYYLNSEDSKVQGYEYFQKAIDNSEDESKTLLTSARSMVTAHPYDQDAIKLLQQIAKDSPHYDAAYKIMMFHSEGAEHFNIITANIKKQELENQDLLYRSIYHKLANEISLLKLIVNRLLHNNKDDFFKEINIKLAELLTEINQRRAAQVDKIEKISYEDRVKGNDYEKIITIVQKTAKDIANFAINKLIVIKLKIEKLNKNTSTDSPLYFKTQKLLNHIARTQIAVSTLQDIKNNIKIKDTKFKVNQIFDRWKNNKYIRNAIISLTIQNGESEFYGDLNQIKSILSELIENCLKHNPSQSNLKINIISQDIPISLLPEGIRGKNIPGNKKYLLIQISDNGKGISKNKEEKNWIFLPRATTSKKGQGTGLGLYIIRETLYRMKGHIQEIGSRGATFQIFIPYNQELT
jgi:tetratricopeptide (TPR) repeat protein